MKPVNIETVKLRINKIESASNTLPGIRLSINNEFELSCLQELLARLESDNNADRARERHTRNSEKVQS